MYRTTARVEIDVQCAESRRLVRLLRAALSFLSAASLIGLATDANASIERERAALERRVTVARQALHERTHDDALSPDRVAQRAKRNSWNNWPNWNNWGNW